MGFWAYLLHCRGGYFYAGHTDDLDRRMAEHEHGEVHGFASEHRPVKLVWCDEFPSRYEALAAERRIKGWSRAKKMALIRGDWPEISRLSRSRGQAKVGRAELVVLPLPEEIPQEQDSPSTSSGRTEMRGDREA
jgi:predicted GIY-YIG superfamily endonuclease